MIARFANTQGNHDFVLKSGVVKQDPSDFSDATLDKYSDHLPEHGEPPYWEGAFRSAGDCPRPAKSYVKELMKTLAPNQKVVTFFRHGKGHHNVVNANYGAESWQQLMQPMLAKNDINRECKDPALTARGRAQANSNQTRQRALDTAERVFTSPSRYGRR